MNIHDFLTGARGTEILLWDGEWFFSVEENYEIFTIYLTALR